MATLCPRCGNAFLQRVRQDGLLDHLLGFLFVYSFRCQICRHRFHALRWGIRYHREPEDRRQYVRYPARFPATLTSQSGTHDGSVTDLSIGGCSIAVFAPYRAGDVLSLRLQTPDDEPPIEVDQAVVRTVSQGVSAWNSSRFTARMRSACVSLCSRSGWKAHRRGGKSDGKISCPRQERRAAIAGTPPGRNNLNARPPAVTSPSDQESRASPRASEAFGSIGLSND